MGGDGSSEWAFIVRRFSEANRECADRRCGCTLHQRDNEGTVNASRQERAERDVGDHLVLDDVGEQVVKGGDRRII